MSRQINPSNAPGAPVATAPQPTAPMGYGAQPPPYAQQASQQPYAPQQPYNTQGQQPYAPQQQYAPQQPYNAQGQQQFAQKPGFGATLPYGQPPMNQPQYGANTYQPQQAGAPMQAGGGPYMQAGAPPMGYQAGGSPMQAGGQPMGGYMQAGGPPMGMGMGAPPVGVVNLVKGGNMSLSKAVPDLRHVTVGLGWDVRQTPGAPFDLDASVFMLKGDGRVRMPQDLIFYNNKQSIDGSVWHHGDNLTGAGEGDDEQISIDLTRVPPDIQKIVCVVSIYEAEMRGQNFGMVNRAFIRVCNADNIVEIVRFDLTEEASMFNCMVFGEVYRYNGEWKFRAIGQGVPGGLKACGPMFGLAMQ